MTTSAPLPLGTLFTPLALPGTEGVAPDAALGGLFGGLLDGALAVNAAEGAPLPAALPLPGLNPAGAQVVAPAGPRVQGGGALVQIQSLQVQITTVQTTLKQAGIELEGLGENVDQLAAALQALGMNAEDAAAVADGIIGSIAEAKLKLKLLLAEQGEQRNLDTVLGHNFADSLALLAAAANTTALTPVAVQVHTVRVEIGTLVAQGAAKPLRALPAGQVASSLAGGSASGFANGFANGFDLARTLAGVQPDAVNASLNTGTVPAALSPVLPALEITPAGVQLVAEPDASAVFDGPTVVLAPQVPVVPQPVQNPGVVGTLAAAAPQVAPHLERVAADKVLAAPRGEVLFKVAAAGDAVELVDAPAPVQKLDAASPVAPQLLTLTDAPAGTPSAPDAATGFAERLARAERLGAAQQAVVHLSNVLENGGGQLRVQLNPAELGQITIDLKIADGQVSGTIAATEKVVVEALARDVQNLRQTLAEAGLKLGDAGLNLMLAQQGSGGGAQFGAAGDEGGRGTNAGWGGAAGGGATAELTDVPLVWSNPDQLLDVRV